MIFKVPCSLEDQSLSYGEFTRKYFSNSIIQDKLMESECDFMDDCVTYEIINPSNGVLTILKKEYPEYIIV